MAQESENNMIHDASASSENDSDTRMMYVLGVNCLSAQTGWSYYSLV